MHKWREDVVAEPSSNFVIATMQSAMSEMSWPFTSVMTLAQESGLYSEEHRPSWDT
jgi:hypothetical protein